MSESAFPQFVGQNDGSVNPQGMTLRDYFAAKALQGMLSYHTSFYKHAGDRTADPMQKYVGLSYAIADAMLAERQKAT